MRTLAALITCLLIALALTLCQCDSDPSSSRNRQPQAPQDSLDRTPMADEEAELAAMVLSHQIIAPQAMYDRIKSDLETIRTSFADSLPQVNIHFRSEWPAGYITCELPSALLEDSVWAGRPAFDSLNQLFRLDTMRDIFEDWRSLVFEGRFNPVYLVKAFSEVPGVLTLSTSGYVGDGSKLYIYPGEGEYLYFFRKAWGDCPAGCINSHIYYFASDGEDIEYRGDYLSDYPDTARPAWIDTVRIARSLQSYYLNWFADSGFVWYPDTAAAWFDAEDW